MYQSSVIHHIYLYFVGAGGEIGGGTAVETARWGANLALVDIHEGRLQETIDKLISNGVQKDKIYSQVGDVTNIDDIRSFVAQSVKKFGKINSLINVVGAKRIKVLQNMSHADLDHCINGNIKSTLFMTQECLPHLKETKGILVWHISYLSP